jgi:hypothetical protein
MRHIFSATQAMTSNNLRPPQRAFTRLLDTRPDPLNVLSSTARVVKLADHVAINVKRIETLARLLALRDVPIPEWNSDLHFFDGTERTVTYLFLLDALNFCFWGEPRWTMTYQGRQLDGYWALAAALKRAVEENERVLDASYLADITAYDLARILRGKGAVPLFVERWRNAQELGRVLRERFGGRAARVIQASGEDAPNLARMIAQNFSSFDDRTVYASQSVNFFKRAQILVADIAGAFGGREWGALCNLEQLTAFADYKLPQILRKWGILEYSPALARSVNQKRELAKDSAEEIEIRAATLWGVEFLREALAKRGRNLTSVQMDWFLWQTSQTSVSGMKPYHRVRTIYY